MTVPRSWDVDANGTFWTPKARNANTTITEHTTKGSLFRTAWHSSEGLQIGREVVVYGMGEAFIRPLEGPHPH